MYIANIWCLLHIFERKVAFLALFVLLPSLVLSQQNMPNYDVKRWIHFGISLGYNTSDFKVVHSDEFPRSDSILVAESQKGQGFHLGIISDLHMGKYFDLRFIPSLTFAEKNLHYILINSAEETKNINSVYIDFPLLLKFKSDRLNNFRLYLLGGIKYAIDMASNAEARNAPNIVKVNSNDLALDYGVGFDFYFPMFKFSPELRVSHGLFSVLTEDDRLIYASVLEKLFSRTFYFSLHFE